MHKCIIYIFKNYFTTVFSISVFRFNKNKLNSNGLYMNAWEVLITSLDFVTGVKWSINEYIFFIRWCYFLGMTTDWTQARFFHIRTWPTGLPRILGPSPFIKRIFFWGPDLPRWAPRAPFRPTRFRPNLRPKSWPNQKRKEKRIEAQIEP